MPETQAAVQIVDLIERLLEASARSSYSFLAGSGVVDF